MWLTLSLDSWYHITILYSLIACSIWNQQVNWFPGTWCTWSFRTKNQKGEILSQAGPGRHGYYYEGWCHLYSF